MNIDGCHYRTIWLREPECDVVHIINQQILPFKFEILDLHTAFDVAKAIKEMHVRGAGLIGAAAAYGMYLASLYASEESFGGDLAAAAEMLKNTRPTAVNLAAAADRMTANMTAAIRMLRPLFRTRFCIALCRMYIRFPPAELNQHDYNRQKRDFAAVTGFSSGVHAANTAFPRRAAAAFH